MTTITDEVTALRTTIARLGAELADQGEKREAHKDATRRLNYLTGKVFVAVEYLDSTVEVFGVTEERRTDAEGIALSLSPGAVVNISFYLTVDIVSIPLGLGGQLTVLLNKFEREDRKRFTIRSFGTRDAAEEWAKRRREELASR